MGVGFLKSLKPDQMAVPILMAYVYMTLLVLSFVVPPILKYLLQWQCSQADTTEANTTCTGIWNLFIALRRSCAWGIWWLVFTDFMSLVLYVAMIEPKKNTTEATKVRSLLSFPLLSISFNCLTLNLQYFSKTVSFALFLTTGLLFWQSIHIFIHPITKRALFLLDRQTDHDHDHDHGHDYDHDHGHDITYFDTVDVTRGTFWLCVVLLMLGFLAAKLEWPALRVFEEEQVRAKKNATGIDSGVDTRGILNVSDSDSDLPR
jgi:hypothetical protein